MREPQSRGSHGKRKFQGSPVKFAALQFYELFNWAGGVQRFRVKKINCYKVSGGYGMYERLHFSK
jgi:hypothetical protein